MSIKWRCNLKAWRGAGTYKNVKAHNEIKYCY